MGSRMRIRAVRGSNTLTFTLCVAIVFAALAVGIEPREGGSSMGDLSRHDVEEGGIQTADLRKPVHSAGIAAVAKSAAKTKEAVALALTDTEEAVSDVDPLTKQEGVHHEFDQGEENLGDSQVKGTTREKKVAKAKKKAKKVKQAAKKAQQAAMKE